MDCDVNAAAKLDHLFARRSTLIIGLPLMRGLNAGQFAGVLAHEFGHFRQGATRRLSYVIQHVQMWLAVAAHHRGWIDQQLASVANEGGYAWMISSVARGSLWLARGLLRIELAVSKAIVHFMTRQMEFDADRYEVRLAGIDAFRETTHALPVLEVSLQQQRQLVHASADRNQLPNNLPELVHLGVEDMDPEQTAEIREWGMSNNTAMYDSHPCSRDRIDSAQREAAKGVYFDTRPAIEFLDRADELCREVSVMEYEAMGFDIKRFELCDSAQHRQEVQRLDRAGAARTRLFGEFFGNDLFVVRTRPASTENVEQSFAAFRQELETFKTLSGEDFMKRVQHAAGEGHLNLPAAEPYRKMAEDAGAALLGRIREFIRGRAEPEAQRARELVGALEDLGEHEAALDDLMAHHNAFVYLAQRLEENPDAGGESMLNVLDSKLLKKSLALMNVIGPIPFPTHDERRTADQELDFAVLREHVAENTFGVTDRLIQLIQWLNNRLLTELAHDLDVLGADWDLSPAQKSDVSPN